MLIYLSLFSIKLHGKHYQIKNNVYPSWIIFTWVYMINISSRNYLKIPINKFLKILCVLVKCYQL